MQSDCGHSLGCTSWFDIFNADLNGYEQTRHPSGDINHVLCYCNLWMEIIMYTYPLDNIGTFSVGLIPFAADVPLVALHFVATVLIIIPD